MSIYDGPIYGRSGTLYDLEPQQEFILKAGGTLNEELPFAAFSAIFDNPTTQWAHVVDTNHFIPPGSAGFVVRLPGVGRAQVEWAAPRQVTQPAAVAGMAMLVIYTHEQLLPGSASTSSVALNPQQTPNMGNFFRVGPGPAVTVIEEAAPGLQIYVMGGILAVSVAVAGGLLAVTERQPGGVIGRTIASIGTDVLDDGVPWNGYGFVVTPGNGLQLEAFGVATGALSILYSK